MTDPNRPRRYFGFHYLLLRFLGLGWWHHPDESDTRNFFGWYLYYAIVTQLVWVVGFVGLETIDPFLGGEKDMDKFMFSLSFVITHDLTLIKLCIFYFRNAHIQDIVHTLEIDLHRYYQNSNKTRRIIKVSRILTASFLFFGWMTIMNASVYGAFQDIWWKAEMAQLNDTTLKRPRTLPQPIYIPWNYEKDSSYIPTFALETVGLLWTGHIVMTIDTFIGSVILHMSCQFVIFQESLTTAYDRTMKQLYEGVQRDINDNGNLASQLTTTNDPDKFEAIVQEHYTEEKIETALETTLKNCFRQHQALIR